jgi:hypothetical protein
MNPTADAPQNMAPITAFLQELGAGLLPGAGVADFAGGFPNMHEGGTYTGGRENFAEGNYGTAGVQTLGALGDLLTVLGPMGVMAGTVARGPNAVRKGLTAGRRVRNRIKVSDDKKIAGAPVGVTNHQGEAARRANYKQLMEEGAAGREWYDDAGSSIMFHVGDDIDMANRVGENFAALSPNNTVKSNAVMSIKGHNQAMAGAPIDTGRFPRKQSPEIADIYSSSHQATGQKRAPFADQLAIGGGFYVKPQGQGHRGVHDIWDGEAWGFANPDGSPIRRGFSPAEHRWMDTQMDRTLKEANESRLAGFDDWTAGRGQAATWTGGKIRAGEITPDEAAFSYADAFPLNYAQQSRESVPGRTTGQLEGILDAPLDVRKEYDDAITRIVYDDQGRDRIAHGYGLLTGESFPGPGVFEGRLNPGRQGQVAVGRAKGSNKMDDASFSLLDGTEASYGLVGAQDASAFHSMSPNKVPIKAATRVEIPLGGVIGDDQMLSITEALNNLPISQQIGFSPIAPVPSPAGVRLINAAPDKLSQEDFVAITRNMSNQLGANPKSIFWGDGSNAYRERPEFFDLINTIEQSRASAGLHSGFDASMPKISEQWMEVDKAMGFPESKQIQTLRKAIANDGWRGVLDLKSKGILSAAAVAALAPLFGQAVSEESEGIPDS